MKIIFFGTSEFAVPALKKLAADSNYQIAAVVTQPDKPAGRKQELSSSPVKVAAQGLGLEIFQFPKLEIENWKLKIPETDIFVVASYGKIIPKEILQLPRFGTLNIHPSLLPKYRGPSPIQAAILNGDKETGVTIMKLDEEMDHGPLLAQAKFEIKKSGVRYRELHDYLAEAGAKMLTLLIPDYITGEIKPLPQDHSKATYTKIITKDDARIDWSKSAEEIDLMIRAYESWPVAWTMLDGKRLKIYEATPSPSSERAGARFGSLNIADGKLIVHSGTGTLEIKSLQLEGAKKVSASEFANGHRDWKDETLL